MDSLHSRRKLHCRETVFFVFAPSHEIYAPIPPLLVFVDRRWGWVGRGTLRSQVSPDPCLLYSDSSLFPGIFLGSSLSHQQIYHLCCLHDLDLPHLLQTKKEKTRKRFSLSHNILWQNLNSGVEKIRHRQDTSIQQVNSHFCAVKGKGAAPGTVTGAADDSFTSILSLSCHS